MQAGTYDTDAALTRGWIDEIAEPDDVLNDALAVARELALLSPSAFAQTKAQLRQPARERLVQGGAATDKTVTAIWCADEAQSRIADYVSKTLKK